MEWLAWSEHRYFPVSSESRRYPWAHTTRVVTLLQDNQHGFYLRVLSSSNESDRSPRKARVRQQSVTRTLAYGSCSFMRVKVFIQPRLKDRISHFVIIDNCDLKHFTLPEAHRLVYRGPSFALFIRAHPKYLYVFPFLFLRSCLCWFFLLMRDWFLYIYFCLFFVIIHSGIIQFCVCNFT